MKATAYAVVTLFVAGALGLGTSCADPVHDQEVSALGPEDPSIPQGEYHRAGQPCGVCHGPEGPASTQFAFAGTIFTGPTCRVGAPNTEVLLVDANGNRPPGLVVTNCVGNFFVRQELFSNMVFPFLAWVRQGNQEQKMISHVSRERSCSNCHKDPNSDDSPGHVYLYVTEPTTYEKVSCPVNPALATNLAQCKSTLASSSSSSSLDPEVTP